MFSLYVLHPKIDPKIICPVKSWREYKLLRYDHKHGEVHTNKLRVFQALPLFIKSWIRVLKIHGMNNVLLKKMDRPNGHLKI